MTMKTVRASGVRVAAAAVSPTLSVLSNLAVWWKADAITGLSDAAAVSSWSDSSGNARSLSQGSGTLQPTYRIGMVNALPAVRFDGSNDYMTNASTGMGSTPEIALVIRFLTYNVNGIAVSNPNNGYHFGTYEAGSGSVRMIKTDGTAIVSAVLPLNTWAIVQIYFAVDQGANASILSVNGSSSTATITAANYTAADFNLIDLGRFNFAGLYQNCEIAEFIGYSGTGLGATNRALVKQYLSAKYAITVS